MMRMRKTFFGILAPICLSLLLAVPIAFAADPVLTSGVDADKQPARQTWFNPSISVGYASVQSSHSEFTGNTPLWGANRIDVRPTNSMGLFLEGELPFIITDRFKVAVGGRWVTSDGNDNTVENYTVGSIGRREWSSTEGDWWTANVSLSYAFVKDYGLLKDVSVLVGFRFDQNDSEFKTPTSVGIINHPSDKLELNSQTWSPVIGLTTTIAGYKSGIFGGDIKLGALVGPAVWGNVDYSEIFEQRLRIRLDGDLDPGKSHFFELFGEFTALSGKITPQIDASLSVFAKYTKFTTGGDANGIGDSLINGAISGPGNWKFHTEPEVVAAGIKVAVAF